jgi:hypothetical protein
MTAAAAIAENRVDPLDAFIECASARALLWSIGEIDSIPAAVDPLQIFAIKSGLVTELGQDAVQKILSDAFAPYRLDENAAAYEAPTAAPKPEKRATPRTTIEAIMWSVRERGPQALHEPANIERLSRCDEAAISEIDRHISKLEAANAF